MFKAENKDKSRQGSRAPKDSKPLPYIPPIKVNASPKDAMMTLTYGQHSNFYAFKERLKTFLISQFGIAASFVETGERFIPPH